MKADDNSREGKEADDAAERGREARRRSRRAV